MGYFNVDGVVEYWSTGMGPNIPSLRHSMTPFLR
jgi:hypothetical protein